MQVGGYTNCYTGDEWDTSICPDPVTCAQKCAIDGADYTGTYGLHVADAPARCRCPLLTAVVAPGITAGGDQMSIKLVTVGQYDTNIGARTYVMDSPNTYKLWKVKNREFVFDVDVSQLPCGVNVRSAALQYRLPLLV